MCAEDRKPVSDATRRSMQGNRGRDTSPEVAIRVALHRAGLRYLVDFALPGLPRRRCDIAFTRQKVAIFVDGCFWHRCPEHYLSPKSNTGFWDAKTIATSQRDIESTLHMQNQGWTVLRFWEHEPVEAVVARICLEVEAARYARSNPED